MDSGLLIVDKPAGLTSHDVVAKVRKKLGTKKVGHAGTLDPDATGVLVLCVGDATRLLEFITADDKTYVGQVVFGLATDTDDASGQVVAEADASGLTEATVESVLPQLRGRIMQQPPRYSAIHVDGKRAYDLARAGVEFELPHREVSVHEFLMLEFAEGTKAFARFRVHCSKGTYIRSLCRDWGRLLNVPAHMSQLRRVQSGMYKIEEAIRLETFVQADDVRQWLRPMSEALRELVQVKVSHDEALRLSHGQLLTTSIDGLERTEGSPESNEQAGTIRQPWKHGVGQDSDRQPDVFGPVAVLDSSGSLVAMTEPRLATDKSHVVLKPKKVFWKGGDK